MTMGAIEYRRTREEPAGHARTREDTTYVGFGTVRPRVQIPGPRPVFELRIRCERRQRWRFWDWGAQGGTELPKPSR